MGPLNLKPCNIFTFPVYGVKIIYWVAPETMGEKPKYDPLNSVK